MSQLHRVPARKALTLVELLVVVTIMVLLVGVVLPLAQPALKGRETREAARQVNTFMAGAAARAMATGRPVGVQFVPSPSNPNRCFSLVTVKERPPYAGDTTLSRVRVAVTGDTGILMPPLVDADGSLDSAKAWLTPNSAFRIKFDYRGHLYDGVFDGTDLMIGLAGRPLPPGPQSDTGTAFQMFLPPRKSAAAPLELPLGTYIDLTYSGFGTVGVLSPNHPTLMLHPNGSMDRYWIGPVSDQPTADLALLIARGKDQQDDAVDNLLPEAGSLWVTVNHRTGHARTTENLGPDPDAPAAERLFGARQSAFSGPNMGGR